MSLASNCFTKASQIPFSSNYHVQRYLSISQSGRSITSCGSLTRGMGKVAGRHAVPKQFTKRGSFRRLNDERDSRVKLQSTLQTILHFHDNVRGYSSTILSSGIRRNLFEIPKNFATNQLYLVFSILQQDLRSFSIDIEKGTTLEAKSSTKILSTTAKDDSSTTSTRIHREKSDFGHFLDLDAEKEEKQSSAAAARRRNRSSAVMFGLEKEREMVEHVRKVSYTQKEQNRVRTAKNVNRALFGNVVICAAKLGAYFSSGSSALLAEFIHSVVDCLNQSLLLVGLRDSQLEPDRKHPYGYGKSVYFWALVSALGTFFLGAGISMTHALGNLSNPSLHEITWEVWTVLSVSFIVDGYVFVKTIKESCENKPDNVSYFNHLANIRDPATLAIILEDGAACAGIIIAMSGIVLSHATGNPVFDAIAGVGISTLLGAMGIILARVNHRFLLGQAIDKEITDGIAAILLETRSIDSIRSVQSQWTGIDTFSYKAEIDFDGTFVAARLMPRYQHEFMQIQNNLDDEQIQVLLALYSEDVIRTVEREVRNVEAQIRKQYPGAEYIELEPMSVDADRLAIDDNLEAGQNNDESDALNRYIKSLRTEEKDANQFANDASNHK